MTDVTQILGQIEDGDPSAAEKLLPLVYAELRRLAAAKMADERSDHTLQGTALVHEAYVRLVDQKQTQHWNSRGHFFAAAAESMRRILVEHSRRVNRRRRLQAEHLVPGELPDGKTDDSERILEIDQALDRFAVNHPEKAALVKLRYFAGMTLDEAAGVLGLSSATADRYWKYARGWLSRELQALRTDDS